MKFPLYSRGLAGALALVYFTTQCALAHAPEASFWAERRRNAVQNKSPSPAPLQLASLPLSTAALPALPPVSSLQASALTPGVDRQLKSRLPDGALAPAARLLGALPAALGTVRDVRAPAHANGKVLL